MGKSFIISLLLLVFALTACNSGMRVSENNGQYLVSESGKPVLQYNFKTVYEKDAINVAARNDTMRPNPSIYAVPRSNYIHPLYGLQGEMLTRDWSWDHPHHRGIYWAWPEVDFGSQRGDLHALQVVFARPTGKIKCSTSRNFAAIEAENRWMWKDSIPIVDEVALIRVYRELPQGRCIDLVFRFSALKENVSIARRGTNLYGGLNIRMQTPEKQKITTHTDSSRVVPLRAWCDLSGLFPGAKTTSGLSVFQYHANPDYPGDWIQYPELSWCQPTFPAAGTRYPLTIGKPLELRYRLFIHTGMMPYGVNTNFEWDVFNGLYSR